MFVYTDRRALSAHLLATLVVQYEFNWMHMHNEANQGQHSRGQYTQMITVPCVESNGGKDISQQPTASTQYSMETNETLGDRAGANSQPQCSSQKMRRFNISGERRVASRAGNVQQTCSKRGR